MGQTKTLLNPFEELLSTLSKNYVFIVDDNLPKAWLEKLLDECFITTRKILIISFVATEPHKSREMKAQLEDKIFASGFFEDTTLIAIGGGITQDMAGSITSTYYHGIACIYYPTTLLAMIDTCIGGKVSLNTSQGENLISSFYHPCAVFINTDWLETLSNDFFNEGIVEATKYSLIYDAHFFIWLNTHMESIKKRDPLLFELIKISCTIKKEQSLPTLLHLGQALALGLITEIYTQELLGCDKILKKIYRLFAQLNISSVLPIPLDEQAIIHALKFDKKIKICLFY